MVMETEYFWEIQAWSSEKRLQIDCFVETAHTMDDDTVSEIVGHFGDAEGAYVRLYSKGVVALERAWCHWGRAAREERRAASVEGAIQRWQTH